MTRRGGAVHVATTRRHYKDKVYETHLLRRSYREGGRVKTETLGNLSHLPAATIELIRRSLKGEVFVPAGHAPLGPDGFTIARSLPHGHVAAAAAMAAKLGLVALIGPPCQQRDLVVGLVLARVCKPGSKLAGWACPLAKPGHSRDGKRGKPQIEYGIIADPQGRPVGVEVLAGNTGDPTSFTAAVATVRERFGLHEVTFVGDRGMITTARITALRKLPGASWITALRAPQIKALAEAGAIQPSLFDQTNLAQITHPDYPGERLVVCRNPALGAERAHKRAALLAATEDALAKLAATVAAGRLKDPTKIALRAGRIVNKYKMAKHFDLHVERGTISWSRRTEQIQAEAAIDGIYVIRTPLPTQAMAATEVVGVYKSLAEVEADFRSWKATDLQLRPIYHWTENRVRAHLLLCLLAGYLTWHLRRALVPITFTD